MQKWKATGIDGIWIYHNRNMDIWRKYTIREGLVDLMKQIWKERIIPEDWKISVMVPIYKKGNQEKTKNRGEFHYFVQDINYMQKC